MQLFMGSEVLDLEEQGFAASNKQHLLNPVLREGKLGPAADRTHMQDSGVGGACSCLWSARCWTFRSKVLQLVST